MHFLFVHHLNLIFCCYSLFIFLQKALCFVSSKLTYDVIVKFSKYFTLLTKFVFT